MDFFSYDLYSIYIMIYIAVIILGGVTLTLSLITNAKEKTRQSKAILLLISSIFFYMLADFVTYYFLGEIASGTLVFVLITLSDTLFCVLVTAWVYAIIVLADIEEVISPKLLVTISAVYLACSQVLSIYLGRYGSYTIQVDDGFWNIILQIFNGAYDFGMIAIGLRALFIFCRKHRNASHRKSYILLIILLIGYMVWISYWDYSTWFKTETNLLEIYAMDPLILMYAILNIFLIYYFYKSDPLKIIGCHTSPDEAAAVMAEKYMLSERESQVLELAGKGMSNRQIASELFISENTVKRHMSSIFKKTGAQSRHELITKISDISKTS